jgi:hypothetical protein
VATVVDGIVPPPPYGIEVRSGILSWHAPDGTGVDHYDIYGSLDGTLQPGDVHIERTTATSVDVRQAQYPYYAVTTTDPAGNVGDPAFVRVDGSVAYPLALNAYPNPFNPNTTIRFDVPSSGNAIVSVFNASGQRVATLFEGERGPGSFSFPWAGTSANGDPVGSGVYFVRLEHPSGSKTLKLALVR